RGYESKVQSPRSRVQGSSATLDFGLWTLDSVESLAQYEAVQLFVDRAHYSCPGFAMTRENALPIAEICYHLDGLPLAIELAAARVQVLTVEQIAARLGERYRLFASNGSSAPPRQQTLTGMMDWSYDLLSDAERALLRQLSVFAGSFSLEAVVAVCWASPGDGC